jgi:hypothetical protein
LLVGCPAADDVVLVVSELAANAIAHSVSGQPGGTFTVRLRHACGTGVRAEVQDQGSNWDGDLAAAARHPHGLWLVRTLSAACGAGRGPGRSGLVWARLEDPAGTRPSAGPGGTPARARAAAAAGPVTSQIPDPAHAIRSDP